MPGIYSRNLKVFFKKKWGWGVGGRRGAPGSSLKGSHQLWTESIGAAAGSLAQQWLKVVKLVSTEITYLPQPRGYYDRPSAAIGLWLKKADQGGPLLLRPQGFDSAPPRLLGHKRNRKGRSCFVAGC